MHPENLQPSEGLGQVFGRSGGGPSASAAGRFGGGHLEEPPPLRACLRSGRRLPLGETAWGARGVGGSTAAGTQREARRTGHAGAFNGTPVINRGESRTPPQSLRSGTFGGRRAARWGLVGV
jgi:hypothetical protein